MPYDDTNVKKMIRDQLEKKVTFSRTKQVSQEVKDLIGRILEVCEELVNLEKAQFTKLIFEVFWRYQ